MDTFDNIYLNDFANEDGLDADEQQNAFNVNPINFLQFLCIFC